MMTRSLTTICDEWLVLRCQDGEVQAYERLVRRWQDRLWRYAWSLTKCRDTACDVTQEAWLAVVRGIGRLDDPAGFGPWVHRIVRNKCADWVRYKQRQRRAEQTLTNEARGRHNNPTGQSGISEELASALEELSGDHRAVLMLHYIDSLTVAEIAGLLDTPVGTVKSRLHHARNLLKQILER